VSKHCVNKNTFAGEINKCGGGEVRCEGSVDEEEEAVDFSVCWGRGRYELMTANNSARLWEFKGGRCEEENEGDEEEREKRESALRNEARKEFLERRGGGRLGSSSCTMNLYTLSNSSRSHSFRNWSSSSYSLFSSFSSSSLVLFLFSSSSSSSSSSASRSFLFSSDDFLEEEDVWGDASGEVFKSSKQRWR
jgi:hypothetical protein